MSSRCVFNCPVDKRSAIGHRFPNPTKNPQQYAAWLRLLPDNYDRENFDYRKYRVCGRHFKEKDITFTKRIIPTAIPTLFLPKQISTPNDCNRDRKFVGLSDKHVNTKTLAVIKYDIEYEHNYATTVMIRKTKYKSFLEKEHDYRSIPQTGDKSLDYAPNFRETTCIKLSNTDDGFKKIGEPTEKNDTTNIVSTLEEEPVNASDVMLPNLSDANNGQTEITQTRPQNQTEEDRKSSQITVAIPACNKLLSDKDQLSIVRMEAIKIKVKNTETALNNIKTKNSDVKTKENLPQNEIEQNLILIDKSIKNHNSSLYSKYLHSKCRDIMKFSDGNISEKISLASYNAKCSVNSNSLPKTESNAANVNQSLKPYCNINKSGTLLEASNLNKSKILKECSQTHITPDRYVRVPHSDEASKQDNDTWNKIQQPPSYADVRAIEDKRFSEAISDTRLILEETNNEDSSTSNTRCGTPTPYALVKKIECDKYEILGSTTVFTGILVPNEVQSVEDPLAIDSLDTVIKEEINEEDSMGTIEQSVGIDEASMGSLEDSSSDDDQMSIEKDSNCLDSIDYTKRDSVVLSGDEESEMERSIPDNDLDNRIEIAYILRFFFKRGKTPKLAFQEIVDTYGHVISMKEVECWYNEFKLENSIMRIIYSGGPVYK